MAPKRRVVVTTIAGHGSCNKANFSNLSRHGFNWIPKKVGAKTIGSYDLRYSKGCFSGEGYLTKRFYSKNFFFFKDHNGNKVKSKLGDFSGFKKAAKLVSSLGSENPSEDIYIFYL